MKLADEIEIVNVGGDGVASEATLKQLLAAMNKMGGGGAGGSSAEAKVKKLANEATAAGTSATKENVSATDKSTTSKHKAAKATNELSERMGRLSAQGVKSLASSLYNLGNEIVTGTSSELANFAQHVPVVGTHLAALASIVDQSVSTYRDLSQTGASFNGSLVEMQTAAANSGMYLDEYAGFLKANSQTLAMFGGSVTEGALRFNKMNKAMKSTGDFAGLTNLGFTVEQINEGMTEYIELQATQGRMAGRSNRDLAAGASRYMSELDKLSKLTGKSRQELAEGMMADSKKANINALLATMDQDQRESFLGTMQAVEGVLPGFKGAIEDLADGVAQTDLGQLLQSLSPAIAEAAAALGRGELTQAEFMGKLKNEGGPALQDYVKSLSAAEVSALQNVEGFGELFGSMSDMNKFIDSQFDPAAAEAEQNAAKARADKLMQFDNTIREVREKIKVALLDSGIFDLLLGSIGMVADGVTSIATAISGFVEKIVTGDIIGALGSLFSGAPAIAAVTGGIAALFLGKAALGAMTRGIGGMATKMTSSLTSKMGFGGAGAGASNPSPSRGGGKGGGGLGKSIGGIGKGIGKGLGGILKGLAGGIAAFANPAVVLGAAALGAAIVLIGGAIAGAAWMVGKALPTMAEGMQSFEQLDGAALIAAGKGMAAIGAGLLVFGAGSALGGAGNVISNIFGALPGKSPLEKLKEFSNAKLDTTQIENNAKAMMAYSKAMAGFDGGPAPSILGAFATGIVSFLGGETDPMAPIKRFGETTLNTANIIANAGAVAAYAFAMKDFPASPAASVFKAAGDAIIGLLGGKTDPMAPIKAFGEMKLNSAQIMSNAFAVSAYAMAIKDFPKSPAADVLGAFKGGIAALLGGDKDPMAPIKRFGEMKLDEQSIIDNAYAVSAYADAVKDFPKSPAADVFSAFKGAVAGLLGGETDPMAPIKRFGEMTLNTANIIANAGAVSAYADAVKDFPKSPSADVFGAFKGAVAGLLGGETDPMAPIKRFGEMAFNTANIIANAGAVKAYADAVKDFPKSPSADVFGAFKGGLVSLLGGKTDPMAPIKAFGDMTFNTAGIIANAGALSAYADAMKDFPASPSASVFTALTDGIIGLLGGKTDPMAPIKAFGDMTFNTEGIVANAGAVKAYADAVKDFPASPAASVFTALTDGIIGLLGGKTDPFAPMEAFGKRSFNTTQLIANADAVSAFATAMGGMPEVKTEKSGGLFGAIGSFFTGADVMPWDHITAFGAAEIDAAAVVANANAMSAFATALTGMPTGDEIEGKGEFSSKTIAGLERISALTGENITSVATSMASIASITGLQSNLDILKSGLDTAGVISYNTAMQDLVDTLGDLNKELSKDNNGMLKAGKGTNAGSVIGQTSSTSAPNAGGSQLNSTMQQVLKLLEEMRDLDIKVERNTADAAMGTNIAARSPSRGG